MRSFIILLLLFSSTCFPQSTIYVSTSGNDNNNGSIQYPFSTIQKAIDEASEGDFISIASGTYYDPIVIDKNNISIYAADLESKPVIIANGDKFATLDGVIRWTSNSLNKYDNVTVDGIIIRNATANYKLRGIWINGNNNKVMNCELYSIKRTGIVVQGENNLISHNVVDTILGYQDTLRGNNISVESYYDSETQTRRNSQYNEISWNTLKNNLTHYAVNIFPDTKDSNQASMEGNIIKYNTINNNGGGIYTRFQRNMEIIGNVISNSKFSSSWEVNGTGITLTYNDDFPNAHTIPFDAGTIKIYNNTIVKNDINGILNDNSNSLLIYNNIFVDHQSALGHGHICFNFPAASINSSNKIDYNIYNGSGYWKWGNDSGNSTSSFNSWKSLTKMDSNSSSNLDPLFTDYANNDFTLQYHSPAKNIGLSLYNENVKEDVTGNPRPDWKYSMDIGAYEVADAQIKVGVEGDGLSFPVNFTLTGIGKRWTKNTSGTFSIAAGTTFNSSKSVTYAEPDTNKWYGWHYQWVHQNTDSNLAFQHGFYKLEKGTDYIYIDTRDALTNYRPNIYIKYTATGFFVKEENTFLSIQNGTIIRIWEINRGNTDSLPGFWNNALLLINENNNPRLVWGEYNRSSSYNLYRNGNNIGNLNSLEYLDGDILISQNGPNFTYNVKANGTAPFSNQASVNGNFYKQMFSNQKENYSLSQNYPNPFNPTTTISFSIANKEQVIIKIFNIIGQEVATILNESLEAGTYKRIFNAGKLSSGIYFYRITAGHFYEIKKLQVLK